jgi:hypothetical protein
VKKIAAILLCAVLLFNWIGYRLALSYFQDTADTRLEARLDTGNYDESQLISLKIPAAHLSVYSNSGQFERTSGEIEIRGIQYKYVKKRLYNDSLEFICIPDHATMKLQSAKSEFFKQVNDLQQNTQGKKTGSHPGPSKNFTPDYYMADNFFKMDNPVFITTGRPSFCFSILPPAFLFTAEQPPETIS